MPHLSYSSAFPHKGMREAAESDWPRTVIPSTLSLEEGLPQFRLQAIMTESLNLPRTYSEEREPKS